MGSLAPGNTPSALTLRIRISSEAQEKLARRAAEAGEDVNAYASELIEQALNKPTIDELLAPVRADFAKTGMTEAEIMDYGRELLRKVRREKKAQPA
jgi:hypothetical protein